MFFLQYTLPAIIRNYSYNYSWLSPSYTPVSRSTLNSPLPSCFHQLVCSFCHFETQFEKVYSLSGVFTTYNAADCELTLDITLDREPDPPTLIMCSLK